jgi:hypothetical protein
MPTGVADPSNDRETGVNNKDKRGCSYVVLVEALLRSQTGEAENVRRVLVDGVGDALCQRTHVGRSDPWGVSIPIGIDPSPPIMRSSDQHQERGLSDPPPT